VKAGSSRNDPKIARAIAPNTPRHPRAAHSSIAATIASHLRGGLALFHVEDGVVQIFLVAKF
jgi:hypothetical protein